ncbi:type II secretion system protein [Halanaerobaculum tunisiense]
MRDNKAGFSLLEVVFVIAIIGSVLLPLVSSLLASGQQVTEAQLETKAINLARWKLNEAVAQDFQEVTFIPVTSCPIDHFSEFEYEIEVNQLQPNLKEVVSKVYYQTDLKATLVTVISP